MPEPNVEDDSDGPVNSDHVGGEPVSIRNIYKYHFDLLALGLLCLYSCQQQARNTISKALQGPQFSYQSRS